MNNVKVITMLPPKITVSKYYAKKRTADMCDYEGFHCRNISALLNVNQVEHSLNFGAKKLVYYGQFDCRS